MFRRKYFENVEDKFIAFLNQVKHVYTPSKKRPPLGDLTNISVLLYNHVGREAVQHCSSVIYYNLIYCDDRVQP